MQKSYARIGLVERETISREARAQTTFAAIACMIGRTPSTVSREIWADVAYSSCYHAVSADARAHEKKKRHRPRKTMRISHESIYQYLYCLPRGELKRELMRGLRQERKRRLSRNARHYRRQCIEKIS